MLAFAPGMPPLNSGYFLAGLTAQAAAAATRKRNKEQHRDEQQQERLARVNDKLRQRQERLKQLGTSPLKGAPVSTNKFQMFPGDTSSYRPGVWFHSQSC